MMPYLDTYSSVLTAKTAAHLLRRATFGPTQDEIVAMTGQTATQAVQTLIGNINYNPTQPLDLDMSKASVGQPYLQNAGSVAGEYIPFNGDRNIDLGLYIKYWWMELMMQPGSKPNLLDKLTLFWQNHFVTSREVVEDYRFVWSYLTLLRRNALGSFRDLVIKMTKEPAMLLYLNGHTNESGTGKANENYARELQELFTVGELDAGGNKNYTEDDVKSAAKVLTGWKHTNHGIKGSTTIGAAFINSKHDTTDKQFSARYNNTIIKGRSGTDAGDLELNELVTMLLNHSQTSRFICRKLYRWYVNTNVTPEIETNVIVPLAALLVSSKYTIQPVIEKLLTSQIFFAEGNIGSMIKSPAELVIGAARFFKQPVPALPASTEAYTLFFQFMYRRMKDLQMDLIDQTSILGYDAYCHITYSMKWIGTSIIPLRNETTDWLIWGWLTVEDKYKYGIDVIAWVTSLQLNFGNITTSITTPPGTAPISCVVVLDAFLKNLFALELAQTQKDFLIDKIMMMDQSPRSTWEFEWNQYRRTVTYPASYTAAQIKSARDTVTWRLQGLLRYLLRMAEFHIF